MLLTAGERISAALLAMATHDLGVQARSFTGSQAGVITTEQHGDARIIDITPSRISDALATGDVAIIAGFQGVSQTTKDVTTLGRGALRHHRGRPRGRARGGRLRDLHRRRRRVHRRPADRSDGAAHRAHLQRGDARDGGLRREGAAPALRRVRPPLRGDGARAVVVQPPGGHLGHRPVDPAEGEQMEQAIISGVAHDRSEAKITVVGVPDKPGKAAAIFEAVATAEINIDMIVQNVSAAATGPDRHLVHAAEDRRRAGHGRAEAGAGRRRLRRAPVRRPDRQGVARRRRHAQPPRGLGDASSPRWPRRASTSR